MKQSFECVLVFGVRHQRFHCSLIIPTPLTHFSPPGAPAVCVSPVVWLFTVKTDGSPSDGCICGPFASGRFTGRAEQRCTCTLGWGWGALIFKIQSKCQAHLNQTSEMSQKSCENILTTSVSYNL